MNKFPNVVRVVSLLNYQSVTTWWLVSSNFMLKTPVSILLFLCFFYIIPYFIPLSWIPPTYLWDVLWIYFLFFIAFKEYIFPFRFLLSYLSAKRKFVIVSFYIIYSKHGWCFRSDSTMSKQFRQKYVKQLGNEIKIKEKYSQPRWNLFTFDWGYFTEFLLELAIFLIFPWISKKFPLFA